MRSLPADRLLEDRLLAIEAVARVHGMGALEHLLVELVRFLDSGELGRESAVMHLVNYIATEPVRPGAVEVLEFSLASLKWPELKDRLLELATSSSADFRNRDLARRAAEADEEGWDGLLYRTLRPSNG